MISNNLKASDVATAAPAVDGSYAMLLASCEKRFAAAASRTSVISY